ncbi:OB-fold protein [Ancylomarina longa]|uniref:Uncharacterized protein n=1 Tax=Ancylomarina longa TaxID=2487017 RepID=A0A434AY84_9BACT|nr:hypothetical protein [Ancylomarina longa]RUT79401.1 hypothetical protein DLK05_04060 [Ancylomarina longa]
MNPKKKKIIKIAAILIVVGLLTGGGVMLYLFNMPHRNVQETSTDYSLSSTELVVEYLKSSDAADEKYLAEDGDSKVLEITGTVKKISEDFKGQKVILLQNKSDEAGVRCAFTTDTNPHVTSVKMGEIHTIKGVIRSGVSFDPDLELYENAILEKCDLIK